MTDDLSGAQVIHAASEGVPLAGWEAITAADGWATAFTGMTIVFVALAAITLFIGFLPKALAALGPWLPEITSHHDLPIESNGAGPQAAPGGVDRRAVAAIAWALRSRQ